MLWYFSNTLVIRSTNIISTSFLMLYYVKRWLMQSLFSEEHCSVWSLHKMSKTENGQPICSFPPPQGLFAYHQACSCLKWLFKKFCIFIFEECNKSYFSH